MVELANIFHHFRPVTALVIGDFMLDKYTYGEVKRISPEAPVSILKVKEERALPGGAGNVALNFLSLSTKVIAIGRIGKDKEGKQLKNLLEQKKADISFLHIQNHYITPVKNRLIATNQQIIRIDKEDIVQIDKELEDKIISSLPGLIEQVDVIALSDYGKGFLSKALIETVIKLGKEKKIPIVVDPKGSDFSKYSQATVIKPNLSEAYLAAKEENNVTIEQVAKKLLVETQAEVILITRSQEGMTYFSKDAQGHFPVHSKSVNDVTGAGDTVLVTICISLANHLNMSQSCLLANIAAGIAIEHIGCAEVTLSDLARRLLDIDTENKIFDEHHLFALTHVLANKSFSLILLDSSNGFTTYMFQMIRFLSEKDHELIIYLNEDKRDEQFLSLLSSIKEVNFIILHRDSLFSLCQRIYPKKVYQIKDDKMIELPSSEKNLLKHLLEEIKVFS